MRSKRRPGTHVRAPRESLVTGLNSRFERSESIHFTQANYWRNSMRHVLHAGPFMV